MSPLLAVLFRRPLKVCAVVFFGSGLLLAQQPSWWADRGVLVPEAAVSDYAPLNQGQLKNLASAAAAELQQYLPRGAGNGVNALIEGWQTDDATNDFAPVNNGQLKAVAAVFYDRLIESGYCANYPWTGSPKPATDYALANIGQAKKLFSFDVAKDSDSDGIADWWETAHGMNPANASDAGTMVPGLNLTVLQAYWMGMKPDEIIPRDTDGDGVPDFVEIANGTDPADYYNGASPVLSVFSGSNQSGPPGILLPNPLVVKVTDASGAAMANAPITFASSTAQVATAANSASGLSTTIKTDAAGKATVYIKMPAAGFQHQISATASIPGSSVQLNVSEFITILQGTLAAASELLDTVNTGFRTVSWHNISNSSVAYVTDWKGIAGSPAASADTYIGKTSDSADGPAFVWKDISTTGKKLAIVSDSDDGNELVEDIGFLFPFYGQQFSQLWVNANGFVYFGATPQSDYEAYEIPSSHLPSNLIAGFIRDLDPAHSPPGSGVFYQRDLQRITIQYQTISPLNGGGSYTFQIVLEQSGAISFYFKAMTGDIIPATVGIQNGMLPPVGLSLAFDQPHVIHDGLAIRIGRNVFYSTSPLAGSIGAGQTANVSAKIISSGVEGRYISAMQMFNLQGQPLSVAVPIPVEVSGDFDHDGLSNKDEISRGTDPFNPDTNGDGLLDGVDVEVGLNPANMDFDGDGLTNAQEIAMGTDPFSADTDHDGVPDNLDAFPLDPTRWQAPLVDPNDHTPPVITLTKPLGATLH